MRQRAEEIPTRTRDQTMRPEDTFRGSEPIVFVFWESVLSICNYRFLALHFQVRNLQYALAYNALQNCPIAQGRVIKKWPGVEKGLVNFIDKNFDLSLIHI